MTLWPLKFFLVWRNSHRLHINNATWHVQHIFWEDIKTPTVKPYLKVGSRGIAQHPSYIRIKRNEFASWFMNVMSWTTYLLEKMNFIYDMGSEWLRAQGQVHQIRLKLSIDPDFKCEIAKGLVTAIEFFKSTFWVKL